MATKPLAAILPQNKQTQNPTTIEQEKRIEEVLSYPILLSDRVDEAVNEAESFKFECLKVGKKVGNLCQMLRAAVRLSTSTTAGISFYDCPSVASPPRCRKILKNRWPFSRSASSEEYSTYTTSK
ncbi:uncharacterized protein Fot_47807 [Forsythia ovata]|uniref:DUF7792 domain-containing protein n=1 Tax=Forsythia ovata TaxID=205694 RepID=A0ABD1QTE2_9LAMI